MKDLLPATFCVLLVAVSAGATQQVYGPVQNYNGTIQTSTDYTVPTTGTWFVYNPISGQTLKFGAWGGQTYTCFHPAPTFIDSYLYVDPCHPGMNSMKLTELCAYNTQPSAPAGTIPTQRGFTAADPEVVIGSGPSYFAGKSGMQYSASVQSCTVGSLSSRLPGYDISKIATTPPENLVYIAEVTIPSTDVPNFIGQFEYTMDYLGQTSSGDPCMPYAHSFQITFSQWDPSVPKVSDIDWLSPHIVPGYVTIITPPNWVNPGGTYGRAGFEANAGSEIGIGSGSFGWTVKGKTPYVETGYAYLTNSGTMVSPVIKTLIVGADPGSNCGTAGYLIADLNRDCYVNFQDFSIFAGQWLNCTDPGGTGCIQDSIIGLGVAYDAADTTGPAVVQGLYDTHVSEMLVGDQVVKLCGISISNGASLFAAAQSLPAFTAGQTIPITVVRSESVLNLNVTAISISLVDANISYNNKNCTQVTTGGTTSYYTCQCSTGSNVCSCLWLHQPVSNMWHNFIWRGYQVQKVCSDSGGNYCETPWLGLL
jgi:hypothetical protein